MKKRKENKKSVAITLAALCLLGVLSVGGTMAYLTDTDTKTNTFTYGKVDIELNEDHWDEANAKNMVANQTVTKDPQIKNIESNDAIVFLKVSVPMKKVVTAADDGTKQPEAVKELFLTSADGTTAFNEGAFDTANWELISTEYFSGTTSDGATKKDTCTKVERVYGYKTKLAKNTTTSELFKAVKAINVIEGQVDAGVNQDIVVSAYAIQADNIASIDTTTLNNATLKQVYDVYVNQHKA